MNKKLNFIFKKKKIFKIILYFVLFIVTFFIIYLNIPKFFNYSPPLIEESLKRNSELNIKKISNIKYKIFPSPRLALYAGSLEHEKNFLKIESVEIDIILNTFNIFNFKKINYDNILIRGGSTNIKINKIDQLLDFVKKNTKNIYFKENNIVLFQKNKKLFEIENSIIKTYSNNKPQLSINGFFLNHKITFLLKKKSNTRNNIILKIPELDIAVKILLNNEENLEKSLEGKVNLEVLNNIFQFNFTKKNNFIINKGFVRSNLINSLIEGEISFNPHFFFNLNIEPSNIKLVKLFTATQNIYFSENIQGVKIAKKLNGFLNLKNIFNGNIIFKNGEISFKDFSSDKNSSILINAKILESGKQGKINFNLLKEIQNKDDTVDELNMSGLIIPSSSKVIFRKIKLNKETFSDKKTKKYEREFNREVIDNLLSNILNEIKMNNFFKNFIN